MTYATQIESLRTQIQNMPDQIVISKEAAIGMLEEQPVYARINDNTDIRVGAIAWVTWISTDLTLHSIDDTQYFFIKN
jgi:hypothetical protein